MKGKMKKKKKKSNSLNIKRKFQRRKFEKKCYLEITEYF